MREAFLRNGRAGIAHGQYRFALLLPELDPDFAVFARIFHRIVKQDSEELLELARRIKERTDITFPTLIPDKNLKEGLLQGILGYPTTWFVDEEGNIIGDPVLGSHSKEDWRALIEERMAEVKE